MNAPDVLEGVAALLRSEAPIDADRHPIDIRYADGVLTLEGEVADMRAKRLAVLRASAAAGVSRVIDRLGLPPAVAMGDGEIRDHVRNALLADSALLGCTIRERVKGDLRLVREGTDPRGDVSIEVDQGTVILWGRAPSLTHRRLAVALAWWVPGTRNVLDLVEVVPPEEDNDAEIADAVLILFEKDPFVDPSKITIHVEDGVVTLRGWVPKESERDAAEHDAWYVEGVRSVVNEIGVAS